MQTVQVSNEMIIPEELLYQIAEMVEPLVCLTQLKSAPRDG